MQNGEQSVLRVDSSYLNKHESDVLKMRIARNKLTCFEWKI